MTRRKMEKMRNVQNAVKILVNVMTRKRMTERKKRNLFQRKKIKMMIKMMTLKKMERAVKVKEKISQILV